MSRINTADLTKLREWRKETPSGEMLASTSIDLLDREWINTAFASEEMYWAKPLTPDQMEVALQQSLTLGLYKVSPSVPPPKSADSPSSPRTPSPTWEDRPDEKLQQIGMARMITDYVTFIYLTDVYLLPEYRKDGLGKWMVACVKKITDGTPELRRALLFTGAAGAGRKFYARELGWWDVDDEKDHLTCMTFKGPGFGS